MKYIHSRQRGEAEAAARRRRTGKYGGAEQHMWWEMVVLVGEM